MKKKEESKIVRFYNLIITGVYTGWTAIILLSLFYNLTTIKEQSNILIQKEAETSFKKDLLYRRWCSLQGGVYAAVSEKTQPNPYLDIPERDIETPTGKKLTLINPAYMTRMVYELAHIDDGWNGHMTSLNPIRPMNTPDNWEQKSLKLFEDGYKETNTLEEVNGILSLRYMKPFKTEKACLKCHEKQGYKEGDIRGGLSISIPVQNYSNSAKIQSESVIMWHSLIWLIINAGIFVSSRMMKKNLVNLKESELRFRLLFNNMSDAVIVYKEDLSIPNNILEANDRACKIFGYDKDDFQNLPSSNIFPENIQKEETSNQESEIIESFGISKDQRKIPIEITKQQFFLNKEKTALTIVRDISSRKQAEEKIQQYIEELKNTNSTKDKLFSIIAHDLRGPIGNLSSILKILAGKDEYLTEEMKDDFLKSVASSAESTYILLENLLDWSRSQQSSINMKPEKMEIYPVVEEVCDLLSGMAGKKQIEFIIAINKELTAYFDRNTVSTVTRNLVSNALKFTPPGGKIEISAKEEQNSIFLSIKDNGVGMDKNSVDSLFKKDIYKTTRGTGGEKGTGLGLLICKDFVEKNGGEIKVESTPGEGTKFTFSLKKEENDII